MDLLSMAVACSFLTDPRTTLRVIEVESQGQAYAIHDNTEDHTFTPRTLPEALEIATLLMNAGHRLDIGLMQINVDVWLKPRSFSLAAAFDPCTNIRIGSIILHRDYTQALASSKNPKDALWRALSLYNTGTDWRGLEYAQRVLFGAPTKVLTAALSSASARLASNTSRELSR
jgi:type IV secretion system protein VirB1